MTRKPVLGWEKCKHGKTAPGFKCPFCELTEQHGDMFSKLQSIAKDDSEPLAQTYDILKENKK